MVQAKLGKAARINNLPKVPMAIPYACAHSGDEMGIVIGKQPREQVLRLVKVALATTNDDQWTAASKTFDEETEITYREALEFQASPIPVVEKVD